MRLWDFIGSLSLPKLWALFVLCIRNLRKVLPTWKATRKSVAYSSKYYGKAHHKNTPANAFRHAIWNYLIASKCLRNKDQLDEVLSWTEKITELHEHLFPNEELAKSMDLHNNKVGREIFCEYTSWEEKEIVDLMRKLTLESTHIKSLEDLNNVGSMKFTHLEEMK